MNEVVLKGNEKWLGKDNSEQFFVKLSEIKNTSISAKITAVVNESEDEGTERDK